MKPTLHFLFVLDCPLTPSSMQEGQTGKGSLRSIPAPTLLISSPLPQCAGKSLIMSFRARQELWGEAEEGSLFCSMCYFLQCKYSYHDWFLADFNLTSTGLQNFRNVNSSCKLVHANSQHATVSYHSGNKSFNSIYSIYYVGFWKLHIHNL